MMSFLGYATPCLFKKAASNNSVVLYQEKKWKKYWHEIKESKKWVWKLYSRSNKTKRGWYGRLKKAENLDLLPTWLLNVCVRASRLTIDRAAAHYTARIEGGSMAPTLCGGAAAISHWFGIKSTMSNRSSIRHGSIIHQEFIFWKKKKQDIQSLFNDHPDGVFCCLPSGSDLFPRWQRKDG